MVLQIDFEFIIIQYSWSIVFCSYTFRNYVHLYNILLPLKRVQRNEIQYDHYFILVVIIGVYHIKLLDLEIYL